MSFSRRARFQAFRLPKKEDRRTGSLGPRPFSSPFPSQAQNAAGMAAFAGRPKDGLVEFN